MFEILNDVTGDRHNRYASKCPVTCVDSSLATVQSAWVRDSNPVEVKRMTAVSTYTVKLMHARSSTMAYLKPSVH